jgi:CubicO group peptidase (beta-lactamase class C family)
MMKLNLIIIGIISFVFFLTQVVSAENDLSDDIKSNQPIQNWLVAGPFPNPMGDQTGPNNSGLKGFDHDFLEEHGGEAKTKFSKGEVIEYTDFNSNKNSIMVIEAVSNAKGILTFDEIWPDEDFKLAYAYTEIYSDDEQTCKFLVGSDDGVKVWLNGELIHSNDAARALTPREDILEGTLNEGNNRLLVKVTDFIRDWGVIVEVMDSTSYSEYEEVIKTKKDFYLFMDSKLIVKPDWESSITFYTGDNFPELIWDRPYLVEKVAGKVNLKFRWFNSKFKEVAAPSKPGMYAFYAEGLSEKGYMIRRASTLYAYPYDWDGWTEAQSAKLDYMPISTLEKSDWINNEDAINRYVGRMFNRSSLTQGEASVLISYIDNQKDTESNPKLNTPIIMDGDYHTKLKRKILDLENKWAQLKLPQLSEKVTKVLKKGSEKEAGFKNGTSEAIGVLCQEWFKNSQEPFDILIARKGIILINKAYGEDGYGKFTLEIPTEIASITKMLTGLIFAQFVDQGLIGIDSYVGEYLPDFEIKSDTSLTFRHCFTHTAGLYGHGAWGGVQNPWMDNSIAALAPKLPVNRKHHYNGIGYNLAGKAMEIVSGKSIFRLFRENLFDPLGMKNTYNEEDLAYGTQSTAYDLALVGQMVLNKGSYGNIDFFSAETFDQLLPKPLNQWYPMIEQDWGIGITWMQTYRSEEDADHPQGSVILSPNIIGHGSATSSVLQVDLDNEIVITQSRRNGGKDFNKYFEKLLLILEDHLLK